jgi:hypothetical protein
MPFSVPLASGVSLTGEDDFCPTFSVNLQISSFTISSASIQVSAGLQTSIGLRMTAQGSFDYPYTLGTLSFGPYVVLVGDVPVVLKPTLSPFVELKGSAKASAYTGLTSNSSITIGASYANQAWGPVQTSSSGITGIASSDDAQLSLQVSAGVKAGVFFYSLASGTATITGDA